MELAPVTILLILNGVTFFLYGWDKRAAKRHGASRVPEFLLQLLALFGGSPGAYIGQKLFRHKTKKASFQLAFRLIVFLQIMLAVAWWLLR